jgi:hypothetical protein
MKNTKFGSIKNAVLAVSLVAFSGMLSAPVMAAAYSNKTPCTKGGANTCNLCEGGMTNASGCLKPVCNTQGKNCIQQCVCGK